MLSSYVSSNRSNLVRGVDFFVRRASPHRRFLVVTECGLQRLALCAYRVYNDSCGPSRQTTFWNPREKLPPVKGSPQERCMRLKQIIACRWRDYLAHPCALAGCQCIVHKLGLPQADTVAEIMHTPLAGKHPVWEMAQIDGGRDAATDKRR